MASTMVGIRELTHNAGNLIRAAASGEHIIVTNRGVPVADIVPHGGVTARKNREAAEIQALNAMLAMVDQTELVENAQMSEEVLAAVEW